MFVSNHDTENFEVKADLSVKQMGKVFSPPLWGTIPISQNIYKTDALAVGNISPFCDRLKNTWLKNRINDMEREWASLVLSKEVVIYYDKFKSKSLYE